MNIDYDPTIRRYTIDGQPSTRAEAIAALRADGLTCRKASTICNIYRRLREYEQRRLAEIADGVTEQWFRAVFTHCLEREAAKHEARRWIEANLRPSRKLLSIYCLKHSIRRYCTSSDYADVLRRCGFRVAADGQRVYAKEVRS